MVANYIAAMYNSKNVMAFAISSSLSIWTSVKTKNMSVKYSSPVFVPSPLTKGLIYIKKQ